MKNEFRIEFASLPAIPAEYGTKRPAVLPRLDLLLRALFLEGRTCDVTSLSVATFPLENVSNVGSTFYLVYRELVDAGRILTSPTGRSGSGESPYAFDIRRSAPFCGVVTWRTVLEAYLTQCKHPKLASAAISATRQLLDLERYSSRGAVLKSAGSVRHTAFHGMVERFLASGDRDGQGDRKSRQNAASTLRALLAFGLRNDLFPLVFPEFRIRDGWSDLVNRAFPLSVTATTPAHVRAARSALTALFAIARDNVGVSSPSDLTEAHIRACCLHLSAPQFKSVLRSVSTLQTLAPEDPVVLAEPVVALVSEVLRHRHPRQAVAHLRHIGTGSQSLETLHGCLEALESHELGPEWREFLEWYDAYSTLDWRALLQRQDEFPSRPPKRELGTASFTQRLKSIRAFLAAAQQVLPDIWQLLTPSDVFGKHFRLLANHIMSAWQEAATSGRGASHRSSAGLHHILCSAGMLARALHDRSVHARQTSRGAVSMSAEAARQPDGCADDRFSSPNDDQLLFQSYEYSRHLCDNLKAERLADIQGSGPNTVKDLRRSIRETPFAIFQRVQLELLMRVESQIADGTCMSAQGLSLSVATLVHGVLLSSGCRRGEICHLREGVQVFLSENRRDVRLRSVDRKNARAHEFALRDRWLPDWFLAHYLDVVRPVLVAKTGATPDSERPFLVLNPYNGRPYGCPEERPDGSGRLYAPFGHRKGSLANLWAKHVAHAFVALGFPVPVGPQRFSMHIVRNVGGHAVFVHRGLEAAAHFLGDRVGSVEGVYAALKGELVDTSMLE